MPRREYDGLILIFVLFLTRCMCVMAMCLHVHANAGGFFGARVVSGSCELPQMRVLGTKPRSSGKQCTLLTTEPSP